MIKIGLTMRFRLEPLKTCNQWSVGGSLTSW